MKTATLISAIITALLMLSAIICGFWIKATNITDTSSIDFHILCGISSAVFYGITLTMFIISQKRK